MLFSQNISEAIFEVKAITEIRVLIMCITSLILRYGYISIISKIKPLKNAGKVIGKAQIHGPEFLIGNSFARWKAVCTIIRVNTPPKAITNQIPNKAGVKLELVGKKTKVGRYTIRIPRTIIRNTGLHGGGIKCPADIIVWMNHAAMAKRIIISGTIVCYQSDIIIMIGTEFHPDSTAVNMGIYRICI